MRRRNVLWKSIVRGLIAGAAGTAAMTVTSTVEAKLRERPPSKAPAVAAEKVLGLHIEDERREQELAQVVHWAYGIAWGGVRGLIGAAGLNALPASGAHYAAVTATAMGIIPQLGVMPPPTQWGGIAVALDLLHHAVYAATTGLAYDLLERYVI